MAALLRATARRSTRPLLSSAPSRTLAYAAPVATDEANIKVEFDVPYELHKLDEAPAMYTYTSKTELVDMFKARRHTPRSDGVSPCDPIESAY